MIGLHRCGLRIFLGTVFCTLVMLHYVGRQEATQLIGDGAASVQTKDDETTNKGADHPATATGMTVAEKEQLHVVMKPDKEETISESQPSVSSLNDIQLSTTSSPNDDWPPLSSLIRREDDDDSSNSTSSTIIGNVSHLLDFAIIGHPKTATSALTRWLHDEHRSSIRIKVGEAHYLSNHDPAGMVQHLYELSESESNSSDDSDDNGGKENYKRGYKSPQDVSRPESLQMIHQYWPQAKLVVGLRHPVTWFESWYNYNVRQHGRDSQPKATKFVGDLLPDRVQFHKHLAYLGKTNLTEQDELDLLNSGSPSSSFVPSGLRMTNPVFLYESLQPFETENETRRLQFYGDLEAYLGVENDEGAVDPIEVREDGIGGNYHYAINICTKRFIQLRTELLQTGKQAADWIIEYFLPLDNVSVSSKEHFIQLLQNWSVDPCTRNPVVLDNLQTLNDLMDHVQERITDRPPLSSLIGDGDRNITGDVQFLLDFAIIGFPKTATSTLMRWMAAHEEIQMYTTEIRSLKNDKPAELVKLMYELPAGPYKRGYKDPRNACLQTPMQDLEHYWPETRLIMGLRHPVSWFESWYNFKIRNEYDLPKAETMIGKDLPQQVLYHQHLSGMAKTKHLSDPRQLELLEPFLHVQQKKAPMPNKVFLYEVSQPFDSDSNRSLAFRQDLSNFVGIKRVLDPPKTRTSSGGNYHYAIDICEDKYITLRKELMNVAVKSSIWIREYFMAHPDVVVSSPDRFQEKLMTWMSDPCFKEEKSIEDSEA